MNIIASNGREVHFSLNSQEISDLLDAIRKRCGFLCNQTSCDDNKIETTEHQGNKIEELPGLLQKMSIMNFKGEIYSGNRTLYTRAFGKCIIYLLNILLYAATSCPKGSKESILVALNSSYIMDAAEWVDSIAKNERESF